MIAADGMWKYNEIISGVKMQLPGLIPKWEENQIEKSGRWNKSESECVSHIISIAIGIPAGVFPTLSFFHNNSLNFTRIEHVAHLLVWKVSLEKSSFAFSHLH